MQGNMSVFMSYFLFVSEYCAGLWLVNVSESVVVHCLFYSIKVNMFWCQNIVCIVIEYI